MKTEDVKKICKSIPLNSKIIIKIRAFYVIESQTRNSPVGLRVVYYQGTKDNKLIYSHQSIFDGAYRLEVSMNRLIELVEYNEEYLQKHGVNL